MTIKKTYSDKLKDPRWQKKRLQILERDNWACVFCLDNKTTLHIHHLLYVDEPWDAPDSCLQTLCENCHQVETELRKGADYDLLLVLKQKNISAEYLKVITEAFILSDVDFSDDVTINILHEFISKKLKKSIVSYYTKENKSINKFLSETK